MARDGGRGLAALSCPALVTRSALPWHGPGPRLGPPPSRSPIGRPVGESSLPGLSTRFLSKAADEPTASQRASFNYLIKSGAFFTQHSCRAPRSIDTFGETNKKWHGGWAMGYSRKENRVCPEREMIGWTQKQFSFLHELGVRRIA